MIHSFTVSNYGSIREKATLELRIPGTAPDLPRFRRSGAKPDVRLPAAIVLVGPNGSGKTMLARALVTAIRIACTPWTPQGNPVQALIPFLSNTALNEPTRFCVDFEAKWLEPDREPRLFRYELTVCPRGSSVPDKQILHEALSHFPSRRRRRLFERRAPGESIYVAPEFGIKRKDDRLKAVRDDASVIATLAALNVPMAVRIVQTMQTCLGCTNIMFLDNWTLPTEAVVTLFDQNADMRQRVKREIQRSDLAIQDVETLAAQGRGKEVVFHHQGLDGPVPLGFESRGTQRLFHLMPLIHIALTNGVPAVIDEIDGDLHVDMVSEIVHWFQSRDTNPYNAQLFVTSHNVGLLDDLEKEELFIVEKGEDGGTRVYGAQDVRGLRRDTLLYPKYRAGVLGGLPRIG